MYFISPDSFSGVFVLPSVIADNTLKTTSGDFIKVILYVFRHSTQAIDPESISKHTGVPVGDVGDALLYWADRGVLTENVPVGFVQNGNEGAEKTADTRAVMTAQDTETQPEKQPEFDSLREKTVVVKPKPLSYDVICRRADESTEVRTLFHEAQMKLGRTIGTGDQSSLLLLHDYYGLPVEVILTLCEYAGVSGKGSNMNYIYTMGIDWSKREIDTLEEADEEFKRLQNLDKNWAPFCEITGIKKKKPTIKQSEYLSVWIERYHFTMEMLSCAYSEMSRHTDEMSFPYMNKILTEWYNSGVNTPEKVKLHEEKFAENRAKAIAERARKKKTPYGTVSAEGVESSPASYDIEQAQQKAKASVPTLKKKEKR